MKDKIKKYLIVFSISLNIGFVIMAGYVMIRYRLPYGDHQAKHSSHISSFEKLELSDDQKKQIEELVKEYIRLSKRPHYSSIQETVKIYTLLKEPGQPSREA
ncbi:hypothetical protein KKA14_12690, partial [bacterium]|nr:hypothetical protein [bacterium]